MDLVRRGYLGLILFIVALVLMPLLVVDYHHKAQKDGDAAPVAAQGAPASAAPTGGTAAEGGAGQGSVPVILGFQGVEEGQTLSGNVQITLATAGDVGSVHYVLSGHAGSWPAPRSPYLFAPQALGWATAEVGNGPYTLTAVPDDVRISPRAISFVIRN